MIDLSPTNWQLPNYPISGMRDALLSRLAESPVLLEAEPGAGKSTLVPLWILEKLKDDKKVLLVQPRILAAQSVAQRLSDLINEPIGKTVGYQVAYDTCLSIHTRLLVVTPGIFIQKLMNDPLLEGVGAVILDEIHERSLQQDVIWALLGELKILRDDLQLIFMSATPDRQLKSRTQAVFSAQEIFVEGRCFPVTTCHIPPLTEHKNAYKNVESVERHLLRALTSLDRWQSKVILIFLPGWYEIEACAQKIAELYPQHPLFRLHSRVPNAEQRKALDPRMGPRIILSTNIAETSLTIEDVNCVIDYGMANKVEFEQRTGLSRLKKSRISLASAEQRRGRAGRLQSGECIRLWSADERLAPAELPEIRNADLLTLAIQLKIWGASADTLEWIESPNPMAVRSANRQLVNMGLLDSSGQITSLGKYVGILGTHPRIATFLITRINSGTLSSIDWLFALALHFDFTIQFQQSHFDGVLKELSAEYFRNPKWQKQLLRWQEQLKSPNSKSDDFRYRESWVNDILESLGVGLALATAFRERIGYLQSSGKYKLNSGLSLVGHFFGKKDGPLAQRSWAVFPWVSSSGSNVRAIEHQGLGVELELSEHRKKSLSLVDEQLMFRNAKWYLQTDWRMGGVVVEQTLRPIEANEIKDLLFPHLQQELISRGLNAFLPSQATQLLTRARIARKLQLIDKVTEPDSASNNIQGDDGALEDDALIQCASHWLLPYLKVDLEWAELPWMAALQYYLGFSNCEKINTQLPVDFRLPSGRLASLNYQLDANGNVSAEIFGKLQEFFGCNAISIAMGKIPLKIHLLSPNGSPLAITQDLASFWVNAYPEVRKEMRGKYPRHPWPESPNEHQATALTKRAIEKMEAAESKPGSAQANKVKTVKK